MATAKTAGVSAPKKDTLSLEAFVHNRRITERRASCAVCRLPDAIKAQVKTARARKVERRVIIEWLASQGHKIDDLDFTGHSAGLHEVREVRKA